MLSRQSSNEFYWGTGIKVGIEELIGPLNEIEQKYAPKELYVAGNSEIAKINPRVSVIGTRYPSEEGKENARKIVEKLVRKDFVIVSGLASGIDTIAHKIAINSGGKTIAVLGTPIDQCYPKENYNLQREIIDRHLAISQFPFGYPVQPKNFIIRNRTMALISNASIIVEAGETSGSHSQGWETLRLGRPLFIIDDIVKNKNLKWPNKMLEYGAEIISIKDTKQLSENVPPPGTKVDMNVTTFA